MSDTKRPKRHTTREKFLAAIVITAAVIIIPPVVVFRVGGGRCCDSTLISSSFIRQAITNHSLDSMDGLPPRTVGLMLLDGTLDDIVFSRKEYEDSLDTVSIRGKTLRDILSDAKRREAMRAELQLPENDEVWESLGRYRFSLETTIYESYEAHVIVALSCYEEEGVLVGVADIRVVTVSSRQVLREMIELDRVAREANGFAPLAIDIEKEIADYRARKNLDPLRD